MVAVRFDVSPGDITSPEPIPENALLTPNQLLIIPHRLFNTTASQRIFPDSEVVYSPSAIDFDIDAFVNEAGGHLSTYKEWFKAARRTPVRRSSSAWRRRTPSTRDYCWLCWNTIAAGSMANPQTSRRPLSIGQVDLKQKGLYRQLVWAMNHISIGYYSWQKRSTC